MDWAMQWRSSGHWTSCAPPCSKFILTSPRPTQQRATPALVNSIKRTYASDAKATPTEVSSILEQRIRGVQEEAGLAETGRVLAVGYVGSPFMRNGRA